MTASSQQVATDCECIAALLTSLETSLDFYVKGIRMQRDASHMHSPTDREFNAAVVDPIEACEFINLIVSVAKRCKEEGTLQMVLFDGTGDVIKSLTPFINAPLRYAPVQRLTVRDDAAATFVELKGLCITTIKRIVILCAECKEESPHLLSLCVAALRRYGVIDELISLLKAPMTGEELRRIIVECIYVCCANGGTEELVESHFASLMPMAVLESNDEVRGYMCAIARELIGNNPLMSSAISTIPSLLKLMHIDDSEDVRSLCMGSINEIYRGHLKNSQELKSNLDAKKLKLSEVVDGVIARLESHAEANEGLEILCCLFEACLLIACAALDDTVFRTCLEHNVHSNLIGTLEKGFTAASLGAKALRVLVERAPPHLSIAPRLVTGGAMEHILAAVARTGSEHTADIIANSGDDNTRISVQVIGVELAVVVGLVLLYSPTTRRKFQSIVNASSEFSSGAVTQQLHKALTQGAIDYFQDLLIVDEEGLVLNDPKSVTWEDDTHPSQQSLHGIVDAQELRRTRQTAGTSRWKTIESTRSSDLKRGYLAFVLLGYMIFRANRGSAPPGAAASPSRQNAAAAGEVAGSNSFRQERSRVEFSFDRQQASREEPQSMRSPGVSKITAPPLSTSRLQSLSATNRSDAAGTAAPKGPMFPHVQEVFMTMANKSQQNTGSIPRDRSAMRSPDDEVSSRWKATDPLRANFKACLKLTSSLAKNYQPTGSATADRDLAYVAAGGGLVMRQQKPKHYNPWDPKPVARDRACWTVDVIKEGDLFFFSLPLQTVTSSVVEAILAKSERHTTALRKLLITTPQKEKGRRYFLHDMVNAVMPQTQTLLRRLHALLEQHADGHVQMALSALPDIRDEFMEKTVNAGNIIACVDFLTHHFAKSVPNASMAAGASVMRSAAAVSFNDASPISGNYSFVSEEGQHHDSDEEDEAIYKGFTSRSPQPRGGSSKQHSSPLHKRADMRDMGLTGKIGGDLFPLSSTSPIVSDSSSDNDEKYFDSLY